MRISPRLESFLRDRAVLLSGLLGALLSLPVLRYHFAFDQGIYATIGDTLLRGGVAYRDAWEFRPPGIFYVYYAAFALLGRAEWSVRAVELLAIATTCAGLARIGAARFGSLRAGIVAALVFPLLYVPLGHWNTAQCESFQLPFLVWALALWPRPEESEPRARRCFWSGLLIGAVILLKTPGLLFAPLLLLDRLWIDRRQPTWGGRLRRAAATAAGLAVLPAVMIGYYGVRGALPTVYQALFVYAVGYLRSAGSGDLAGVHWYYLLSFVYSGLPAAALGCIGLLRVAAMRGSGEAVRWVVLFAAALAAVLLQGRHYLYHTIMLLPFFALAVGVSVAGPVPADAGRPRRTGLILTGLSLVLLAFVVVKQGPAYVEHGKDLARSEPSWAAPDVGCAALGFSYEESRSLAAEVRARTGASDRVFLWSNLPLVYFLSDRRMAGPYSHVGMMIPHGESRERLDALVRRLGEERPRLVVTGGTGAPFQAGEDGQLLERFPEIRAFLARGYRAAGSQGPHRFWMAHE